MHVNPHSKSAAFKPSMKESSHSGSDLFWRMQAKSLNWRKPFTKLKDISFDPDNLYIRWFEDGFLNIAENCIDRHLPEKKDKTAIIWQSQDMDVAQHISYQMLYEEVSRLSNALTELGVKEGHRVIIYMPMIPEAAYAMLACARIGAIHSVVFGGFSARALADRIDDSGARVVITATHARRGSKRIMLKDIVDDALALGNSEQVDNVVVVRHPTDSGVDYQEYTRDIDYRELVDRQPAHHVTQGFPAEHPLFILYTSGSTGKPKGIQHATGGYLCYADTTFRHSFAADENDVYWCSADIGWITGHTYVVYGPLAAGATTVMYEGVPNYPDLGRFGEIIDRHKVSIFYTAPTAIRLLMADKAESLNSSERSSLRLLGSAGEPINPGVWDWFRNDFGNGKVEVLDTWWQTETGGQMILPLDQSKGSKPGSAGKPFTGVHPQLVESDGTVLEGAASGHLVITESWPGQGRTIWGDHQRFVETYFTTYPGKYFTGDGARRDEDGDYWITGRVDDVLNVSGHRLGTAEIESAAVQHPLVTEAAVVGYPHDIKGEAIYIYAAPVAGTEPTEEMTESLRATIRGVLGPIASPDKIQWAKDLPKTRSGKIMRRILRKIASNELDNLGDTSTLADPTVVTSLIEGRLNRGE
ncbi:MAG: acetate--CoA ligase [Oceanospirillaceae bacterium]|nr:acetate--CoA ligase [Oceanospirillaceae bacterium]|tara:strand:+ start:10245 stop:12170 length:1926 start_codon:yes stop_codon:yes gene_type:complete